MAKAEAKKTQLPKDFEKLLAEGDLAKLHAVFATCDVNARGGYSECTALAFDKCPDELARWLVADGADLSAADTWRNTPLHSRARSRQGRIEVLLELGADVHARASIGTPLHAAADAMNVANAKLLIAAGADVNATNDDALTPLAAALRGCSNAHLKDLVPLARLLLDAGATKTPAMQTFVTELGKRFEFVRKNFNPDTVGAASAALEALYAIFEVAAVPQRTMHDGTSPIVPRATTWQKQHAELWGLLVPGTGPAATVQGEVIRIAGRIADELERNAAINWDDGYRAMAQAFLELVARGTPLADAGRGDAERIVAHLVHDATGDTDRLAELAVQWVLHNPTPLPLGTVAYNR